MSCECPGHPRGTEIEIPITTAGSKAVARKGQLELSMELTNGEKVTFVIERAWLLLAMREVERSLA